MDLYDIRFNVLLSLDPEVLDLHNASVIDKMSDKIMSDVIYWRKMYEKHHCVMNKFIYNKSRYWIIAFEKELTINIYTNLFFDYINEFDVESEDENLYVVQFSSSDSPLLDVLDISENDHMNFLLKDCNKRVIDILEDIDNEALTAMLVLYKDGYRLVLSTYYEIHEYIISADSTKKIIYNLICRGVIPYDGRYEKFDLDRLRYTKHYQNLFSTS